MDLNIASQKEQPGQWKGCVPIQTGDAPFSLGAVWVLWELPHKLNLIKNVPTGKVL